MNRLILLRHGKAETNAASGKDFDRALAPRGRADAAATGARLADAGFIPDLVLVSSARRTQETWEAAQPSFPNARVEVRSDLYNAGAGLILKLVEDAGEDGAVMVVGHNPGLHEVAIRLLERARSGKALIAQASAGFPTAAAAAFDLDGHDVGHAEMFTPQDPAR